jgi:hypothetical protein
VLHFGHFGHSKSKFNRVMFIAPESNIKVRHDIIATVMPGEYLYYTTRHKVSAFRTGRTIWIKL